MELTVEKVEKLLGEATPGRWQAEQGAYNNSPWIITALTPEQPRDEDDTQGDIYLGQGYTGTNDEHLVADVFLLGPYKALHSSQANAEIMAAAPDLARLCLTLHTQLQQEREGREKLERELAELRGEQPTPWDKDADQNAVCVCGHSYERHFDSYEDMEPVGCKYCACKVFQPPAPQAQGGEGT